MTLLLHKTAVGSNKAFIWTRYELEKCYSYISLSLALMINSFYYFEMTSLRDFQK